jgi:hypothetical protein
MDGVAGGDGGGVGLESVGGESGGWNAIKKLIGKA